MERSLERLEKRSPEGQVTWECPRGVWSGKLESPSVDGGRSKLTNSPPPLTFSKNNAAWTEGILV